MLLIEKRNFVCDDRAGAPDARHRHRRLADVHHDAGVVALQVDVAVRIAAREAGDLGDEAQAPGLAAELAVGDHAQAERLLPADDLGDRLVGVLLALQQRLGAQEAADVLGAKRRAAHRTDGSSQ